MQLRIKKITLLASQEKECNNIYLKLCIFMNNRQEVEGNYVPSKYSKAFNSYSKNQIRSVIPVLKTVARHCNIGFKYPIYKIIKAIARIFLLNEIEAIFFAYMIRETNWDIKDRIITQNAEQVKDIVCYLNDHQPEYKSLILYLVLVTYSLKYFLNQKNDQMLEEATKICPNFKLIFENWAKKNSQLTNKINPKTLNKVYQELFLKIRQEDPDYCLLVDGILQISPAYNPEKNEKDKKNDKKEKEKPKTKEQNLLIGQPYKMQKTEQLNLSQHNPLFSSSRLYEMAGGIGPQNEVSNFQVFGGLKSGVNATKFGGNLFRSSGVLGFPQCDMNNDDLECEQLNLGLREGQSEQNIILIKEELPEMPQNTLNLSKGVSITEKYLNFQSGGSDYFR